MKFYISGVLEKSGDPYIKKVLDKRIENMFVLCSFAYWKDSFLPYQQKCKDFLLDSGAFTIMDSAIKRNLKGQAKKQFDPMEYTRKYANFVKERGIDKFIEMDIEAAYGVDVYKDCLHCLQDITGKDPVPVWHRWRGWDYWCELVKKHNFVCIGDASNHISKQGYKYFKPFLDKAHESGCKVHGLAITQLDFLRFLPFDSVDSSTWSVVYRFGQVKVFDGHSLRIINCERKNLPEGKELDAYKAGGLVLDSWISLQKYLEQYEGSNNKW